MKLPYIFHYWYCQKLNDNFGSLLNIMMSLYIKTEGFFFSFYHPNNHKSYIYYNIFDYDLQLL